ncbi:MAG: DNA-protecting protein DprA [Oscillospiraceae bacterium]|nr:DNA-protecting protein DprA [Oscillospiraceae bacterium]
MLEHCEKNKIRIVTIDDDDYPVKISSIYNPPTVLFYRGDISHMDDEITIAVCGTRNPSLYSLKVCVGLTNSLLSFGISIVSGFSDGIEKEAQTSALRKGYRVYGFVPAGIDDYRSKTYMMFKDLTAARGAVISEYLPGNKNSYVNFGRRNRLMAAASSGVCIVETAEKSGSLSIVEAALSHGRDIFAVTPHDLFDPAYKGNVGIIRDGGTPIMGAYDVYREYFGYTKTPLPRENEKGAFDRFNIPSPQADENDAPKKHRKSAARVKEAAVEAPKKRDFSSLLKMERMVAETLNAVPDPLRPDVIAERTGIGIDDLLTLLTDMELSGIVKTVQGSVSLE